MSRPTFVRALVAALITVFALLPGTASAAKPIAQFHDHFTDSFSDEICGIAVDVDVVVTDNFFLYADETFKDTSSVQATFTNPENGKSVVVSNAGQISTSSPLIDEEAGTITFLTSFKGFPRRSRRRTDQFSCATLASSPSRTPSIVRRANSSPRRRSSTTDRTLKSTVTSLSSAR